MFMPPGHKLGSDVPFTQWEFSPGVRGPDLISKMMAYLHNK
jgi:hypothetical protein